MTTIQTEGTETYIDPEFVELMNVNIVWVEVANQADEIIAKMPYTRMSIPELAFEYDQSKLSFDDTCMTCYCLATKQYVTIDYDDCRRYHYHDTAEKTIQELTKEFAAIDEAKRRLPDVDPEIIIKTRYREELRTFITLVWDAYIFTEFKIENLEKIYDTTVDSEWLDEIKTWYLDKIRKEREQSFIELDQLEEESKAAGATEDDLEDINTIKQMFRDIPQDIDLSKFKTASDLFDFWPSLLQPRKLGNVDPMLKQLLIQVDPLDEIKKLLQNCTINDIDELMELAEHITQTIPPGQENIEIDSLSLLQDRITELQASNS